jgi:hypothetical protein
LITVQTEYRYIPPIWDFFIHGHEACVDIGLFRERATSLDPDLLAVVKECVGEGGRDRREREPVGHGEGHGEDEGTVGLVSFEVERGIAVDDLGDVEPMSLIIEGA